MLLCLQGNTKFERVLSLLLPPEDRSDTSGDVSTGVPELIPVVTQQQPDQTATDSVKPASSVKVITVTLSLFVAIAFASGSCLQYRLCMCSQSTSSMSCFYSVMSCMHNGNIVTCVILVLDR